MSEWTTWTGPPFRACCLKRGWCWERVTIDVRDDHRAAVAAHVDGVLRYATGSVRTRYALAGASAESEARRLSVSLLAELVVAEVLQGVWGEGDASRPDVIVDGIAVEVRWTSTAHLSVFPDDQDRLHLDRPFVFAEHDDPVIVRGFAYGWDVLQRGVDRTVEHPDWRPGHWLHVDDLCRLPLHESLP